LNDISELPARHYSNSGHGARFLAADQRPQTHRAFCSRANMPGSRDVAKRNEHLKLQCFAASGPTFCGYTSGPEVAVSKGMTTHFTPLQSTSRRPPNLALFGLTTSPSIDTRERKVDEVLADSFPASDPPPWTLGRVPGPPIERTDTASDDDPVWSSHTTVIVAGGKRTAWQWMATGVGAIGMGMVVPIAILVIGIPIALATRTLIEVAGWLAALVLN
jgi:hypothetical protein